jgi:hypothetical protein
MRRSSVGWLGLVVILGIPACDGAPAAPTLNERCLTLCQRYVDECASSSTCTSPACGSTVAEARACEVELAMLYDCQDALTAVCDREVACAAAYDALDACQAAHSGGRCTMEADCMADENCVRGMCVVVSGGP